MKKVLICGMRGDGNLDSIASVFSENGYDVTVFKGINRNNIFYRLYRIFCIRTGKGADYAFLKAAALCSKYLLRKNYRPDIFFEAEGGSITDEYLKTLNCKKILFMTGKIKYVPTLKTKLSLYDNIYTYEINDVEEISALGVKAEYIPAAANNDVYKPLGVKKDIDIFFAGKLTEKRLRVLKMLCDEFDHKEIRVFGKFFSFFNFKYLFGYYKNGLNTVFKNYTLSAKRLNKYYSRSRICINLQQGKTEDELNSRYYEILAAKGFQIITGNKSISTYCEDKAVVVANYEDLVKEIRHYLSNCDKASCIANKGFKDTVENNCLSHRIEYILKNI